MKHLILVILKIVEIVVVVFVPYYVGFYVETLLALPSDAEIPAIGVWAFGVVFLGCAALVVLGGVLLTLLNKKWSETIWLKIKAVLEKK